MMGLSDSERISMIRSAVLTRVTRVADGQTDGIGVAYTRYSIYAVARKNRSIILLISQRYSLHSQAKLRTVVVDKFMLTCFVNVLRSENMHSHHHTNIFLSVNTAMKRLDTFLFGHPVTTSAVARAPYKVRYS